MKIYIDGGFFDREEAKISVFDHGLLYGDGIFEGIRLYGGKIYKLQEHISRLFQSARALNLSIPMDEDGMCRAVQETVDRNEKTDAYIRLVVTRGKGNLGIDPSSCPVPSVIIIVDDISMYPRELYEKGIPVITAGTRRLSPDIFDPRVKSLNYLTNIMAKMEARAAGCLEAVLLNRDGYVTECTADNIFIIREGKLITPAPWLGILEGVTRASVLELAGELGISYEESTLTRYDLYIADECFLTGTGAEIIPVVTIDSRPVGNGSPGDLTLSLREAFTKKVYA